MNMSIQDSLTSNHDGYGYYTPSSGVRHTEEYPANITNLGVIIAEKIKTPGAILAHVRLASSNNLRKLIGLNYCHPFVTDDLVFAHNGALSTKDKDIADKYKDKELIDSQIFLSELEEKYKSSQDTKQAIIDTVGEFDGKFAFLIYNINEKQYYAVRGLTALLHISYITVGNQKGYVVNTDKNDLNWALIRTLNIAQLLGKNFSYTPPTELKTETIYKLNDSDIEEIGVAKQTAKTVNSGKYNYNSNSNIVENIATLLERTIFGVQDLEELSVAIFGKTLIELSYTEWKDLSTLVIPALAKRTNKKIEDLWSELLENEENDLDVYMKYKLQFPYMMNDARELKNALKTKRKEEARATESQNIVAAQP